MLNDGDDDDDMILKTNTMKPWWEYNNVSAKII